MLWRNCCNQAFDIPGEQMLVPWQELPSGTLTALIEEYVSRDGTDYGEQEVPVETRVKQVHSALERNRLVIWFDEKSQTVTLLPHDKALSAQS